MLTHNLESGLPPLSAHNHATIPKAIYGILECSSSTTYFTTVKRNVRDFLTSEQAHGITEQLAEFW